MLAIIHQGFCLFPTFTVSYLGQILSFLFSCYVLSGNLSIEKLWFHFDSICFELKFFRILFLLCNLLRNRIRHFDWDSGRHYECIRTPCLRDLKKFFFLLNKSFDRLTKRLNFRRGHLTFSELHISGRVCDIWGITLHVVLVKLWLLEVAALLGLTDDSAIAVIDQRRQMKKRWILTTFLFEVVHVDWCHLKAQSFDRLWESKMGHHASLIHGCSWIELLTVKALTIHLRCRLGLGSI